MVRNRSAESIPTHASRDDFGLARRACVQAIRVASEQEGGGGRRRPGLNSWLSACVGRIRGVKAK